MTTETYAVMNGNAIENIVVAAPEYATTNGWLGPIDGPGIGWTTPDAGSTWQPPAPATVAPQAQSATAVADLAASMPAKMTQLQADIATFATFTPADLATQAALDVHQRVLSGLADIVGGMANLAVATGVLPEVPGT